jgi:hypothetical protein
LLKGIIKDQSERYTTTSYSYSTNNNQGSSYQGYQGGAYTGSNTSALRNKAQSNEDDDKDKADDQIEEKKELTLQDILDEIVAEHNILDVFLNNL